MAVQRPRASGLLARAVIVALAAGLAIAGIAGGGALDEPAVRIEVRVWQHVDDDRNLYISARPADGSWRTLGTVPLALDDGFNFDGDFRYGDTALDVPLQDAATVTITVRTWQHVEYGGNIQISARAPGGDWASAPLPLDGGLSATGAFRYVDGALSVPLPSGAEAELCSNGVTVPDPERNPGLVQDCTVLLRARDALRGSYPEWADEPLANWSGDVPVREWESVVVSGSPPRVTELVRKFEDAGSLDGVLPDTLAELTALEVLDLSEDSYLTDGIPPELGRLSNLRTLNLGDNRLYGRIPPELGQLAALEVLDLNSNYVMGGIPPELGRLSNLETLRLGGNGLTGGIPPELGRLTRLRVLSLASRYYSSTGELTGAIPPELGQLSELRELDLSGNQLTDAIPPELGWLGELRELDLSGNQLTGAIPGELGALSSLETLRLAGNELSGEIPPELGSMASLTGLSLFSNSLTGAIPPELGLLAGLTGLDLRDNRLSGEIPLELGGLSNLELLYLDRNELSGPLPPELGQLASLTTMSLSENQLTGGIPREFGQLTQLETLDLRNNQLAGEISAELANLNTGSYWLGVWLAGNQWTGCLPLALRPLLEAGDYSTAGDLRDLGLRYCQCLAPPEDSPAPDLKVGVDGIPHLTEHEETGAPGTYRLSFSLVIDLPPGGVFELGERYPGRDADGEMSVTIYETTTGSSLTIDPFTGYEYGRLAIDGPAHCEGNPSVLFDAIVASAREQPPYTPPSPETIESIEELWYDDAVYLERGATYWLNERTHLAFDVPEGWRFRLGGNLICFSPGRCQAFLEMVDEESDSSLSLDIETAEDWHEVTDEGRARGVDAVFDQIAASVRQHPPPPSCDNPATAPDCAILLEARDILAGDAELNWSADVSIHHWWGVTVDRWTGRVAEVHPAHRGLTGRIPAALGRLSALKLLWLGPNNDLTGEIPPELGQLSELETLYLGGNRLTGEIPNELGALTKLEVLNLDGNLLEGCIPEALLPFWGYRGFSQGNPGLRNCSGEQ